MAGVMEYTLVDCITNLIYGPFETLQEARRQAENLDRWEIVNADERVIDWSPASSEKTK
jgi:hypothetical protein